MVADAKKRAEIIKADAEADLKDMEAHREQWLKQRVQRMEDDAIAEIQAQIADLASQASVEILSQEIDQKTHDKMVDETIKTLSSSVH